MSPRALHAWIASCALLGIGTLANCADPGPALPGSGGAGGGAASTRSTSSQSDTGGATSVSTSSGTGACDVASDCPDPGACKERACVDHKCAPVDAPQSQSCGDSQAGHCDGKGSCIECDTVADCNQPQAGSCAVVACTSHQCVMGKQPVNTACTTDGGSVCDDVGACVACTSASQCAGNVCRPAACTGGVCGAVTPLPGPDVSCGASGGQLRCDGMGNCVGCMQDTDCVAGSQCTDAHCDNGSMQCTDFNRTDGTTCDENGGQVCGSGRCVQCLESSDCQGMNTECVTYTCAGNNTCQPTNLPATTACASDGGHICDGSGNCVACNDAADCGVNTACQSNTCSAGHNCTTINAAAETRCGSSGNTVCDGAGNCVQCDMPSDCPTQVCRTSTCNAHSCGSVNLPSGSTQTGVCDSTQGCGTSACACDGSGSCKKAMGASCTANADCASGQCNLGSNKCR